MKSDLNLQVQRYMLLGKVFLVIMCGLYLCGYDMAPLRGWDWVELDSTNSINSANSMNSVHPTNPTNSTGCTCGYVMAPPSGLGLGGMDSTNPINSANSVHPTNPTNPTGYTCGYDMAPLRGWDWVEWILQIP